MKKLASAVLGLASTFAMAAMANAQAPTDPQIVGIVQTANRIDIAQAHLALRKSTNPQVKEFANQMISDHTNLEKSVNDLANKLGVKEASSDTSKQLKQGAAKESKKLSSLKGNDFDREYVSHEIAYHQAVINAATNTLIPNAKNAQLKSALEGAPHQCCKAICSTPSNCSSHYRVAAAVHNAHCEINEIRDATGEPISNDRLA